ncbi:MAG: PilN domain-containing protein [Candidatus Binatia bacterium]
MIRINLLPAEEARLAADRRQELAVGSLAIAGVLLLFVLAHVWQQARLSRADREVSRLTQELVQIQQPYANVTKIEQQKRELREKLKVIGELEAKRLGPVRVLQDVASATPDKLWLTEFSEIGGSVKVSGLGVDEQTVADFMRRLAASNYFRGVDLEETSLVDQEGIKHKKFVVKGEVNYLGTGAAGPAEASAKNPGEGAAKK